MLIENVDVRVKQTLYKLCSMSLCSNVTGQLMLCNVCNPPRKGEPSYERYVFEKQLIHARNSRKAEIVYKELNTVPGIRCQRIQGGVFGFPRIELPKRKDAGLNMFFHGVNFRTDVGSGFAFVYADPRLHVFVEEGRFNRFPDIRAC